MEGAVQKRCDIGINRNIVECKVKQSWEFVFHLAVLIET